MDRPEPPADGTPIPSGAEDPPPPPDHVAPARPEEPPSSEAPADPEVADADDVASPEAAAEAEPAWPWEAEPADDLSAVSDVDTELELALAGVAEEDVLEPPVAGEPDEPVAVPTPHGDALGAGVDEEDDEGEALPVPPVVAVVVVRDPGPWLEETLGALVAADYPRLSLLVLDDGSTDDPTPRIAEVAPGAFVRRLEEPVGFAAAASSVIRDVQGAPFLLFCHDDVVLDAGAVRVLVEEAFRSNAGVVGPKVVRHDDPSILLEVGMTVDRLGVPHSAVEPGELDQEQHDAVRDVFFVSSTVMLVRADLFAELGGFDPETSPGAEDLDLCWRARIAGARVMVAPDARARHRGQDELRDHEGDAPPEVIERNRHRVTLACASAVSLAWMVPAAIALALVEAVLALFTGHRARGRVLLLGWWGALRGLGERREARRRAQSRRIVEDSELRYLQSRGSTRVRRFATGHLHADERLRDLSARSRTFADSASSQARRPLGLAMLAFAVLVLLGSRGLVFGSVPDVAQLRAWPGVGDLWSTYLSAWRFSDLGAASAQPPLLATAGGLGALLLGASGLARTLLVVLALPFGVLGAWRLGRAISGPGGAAVATGLVYGIVPLPRNAIALGRPGPLVTYAVAPFVLLGLARLVGLLDRPARPRRTAVSIVILSAFAACFWPVAVALPVVLALGLLLAGPLVGGTVAAARALGWACLAALGALVLLVPWPLVLVGRGDRATLGFAFAPVTSLGDVVRFVTGPSGVGVGGWVLLGAAFAVLLLASGPRLAWAARGWALMIVGFGLAWLPGRFAPHAALPAVEGLLVPAALGLAIAVGLGAAAFAEDVARRRFGWRQVLAVVAGVSLVLPALGFAADALGGRWRLPTTAWASELDWMDAQRDRGGFRVLWLGDPSVLPVDPARQSGVGFGVTRDGTGDVRALVPVPSRGAQLRIAGAVDALVARRTSHLGARLAPLAVRYLAVPLRPDPGAVVTAPPPPGLEAALAAQLDLRRLETRPGLVLYENDAWRPALAGIPASGPTVAVRDGGAAPAGILGWAETYDGGWRATRDGGTLRHGRLDGWANAFAMPAAGKVDVSYTRQWLRYPAVLLQVGVLVGALVLWFDRPRRRRADDALATSEPEGGPLIVIQEEQP